ncbi:glycerophosphodiester phosphodiesterase [Allobacillus sp. GCM10007491]|uniref:Glycerophosphodiester phosphodiesterase n=1 Tax=Allobacillus saliphilus TaxID=2912308 RepID=A0A941CSM6_9BACI|nr:glycerophosphodiester phosphodiesterase [Allobacillus saliphilus]MBR7553187.1 glycerophosphodiester phosphodiesterase [Allobacillus saliphilus]
MEKDKRNPYKTLSILLLILGAIYILLNILPIHHVNAHPFFENGDKPLVIAHQGGEHLRPSNTMIAFEYATELGADVLETDIHISKDGYLIAIHDPTVDRTTDGIGRVADYTLKELKQLDAGYYFEKNGKHLYRGQGIQLITIEELFQRFPNMHFVLEIKDTNPDNQIDSIIKRLVHLINTYEMREQVLIGSFDQEVVDRFRTQAGPGVVTSGGRDEVKKFVIFNKFFLKNFYRPQVEALQIPQAESGFDLTTESIFTGAKRIGMNLHYWTVNDPKDMRRLIEKGADGITTDRPDLLIQVLNELGY